MGVGVGGEGGWEEWDVGGPRHDVGKGLMEEGQ